MPNGERDVRAGWTPEEAEIAEEFLRTPGRSGPNATAAARRAGSRDLIDSAATPGAASTIAYRRRLIDSPSYTLNHEEVAKALEEGMRFAECLTPEEVEVDEFRCGQALRLEVQRWMKQRGNCSQRRAVTLPARTILVAAGTQPNTVLAREDEHNFRSTADISRPWMSNGDPVKPERVAKPRGRMC